MTEEAVDQLKQTIALANVQLIVEKASEKCFSKCITKPGPSLEKSEQKCLAMCFDRYMESHSVVAQAFIAKLREQNS